MVPSNIVNTFEGTVCPKINAYIFNMVKVYERKTEIAL
jgi:hypothetical protein